MYHNSCLKALWKEEDTYYDTLSLKHIVKLKVLTEQMFRPNSVPNG
jgi:hypothetical protein